MGPVLIDQRERERRYRVIMQLQNATILTYDEISSRFGHRKRVYNFWHFIPQVRGTVQDSIVQESLQAAKKRRQTKDMDITDFWRYKTYLV